MSSIYTDNFKQILNRVNSRSKLEASEPLKKAKKNDEFAKLLSSIENKKDFLNTSKTEKKEASPRILTNMGSDAERSYSKIASYEPSKTLPQTILGDIPLEDEEIKSVNNPVTSDNVTTQTQEKPLIPLKDRIEPPASATKIETGKKTISDKKTSFDTQEIKNIITTAGRYHGVDPSLGLAIAQVESALKPDAVSKDGFASKGIFQLLDSTAEDMRSLTGMNEPYQPFDPGMNSFLGMGYLRRLLDIFSQDSQITNSTKTTAAKSASELEKIAVAAYNAGEGSVARAQEYARSLGKDPSLFSSIEPHLPAITRSYVKKVHAIRTRINSVTSSEDIS